MALDELTEVLGRQYCFRQIHAQKLIDFLTETQTLADKNFYFSYNVCRASGEKFVIKELSFSNLEKLLNFYNETLARITLNGHEMGYRRASIIHQNFANVYARMFDHDKNTAHLEKAIEHNLKSTEYAGTEAHKAYTYGFMGEYSRKIYQQTRTEKDIPWAEKSLEYYKKSRDLSENPAHKAHCLSYMGDVFRDIYEVKKAIYYADEAIKHYLNGSDEIRNIKPAQVFHNLSYAGDVAFSVFSNTDIIAYLKKAHALYHMALREQKTEKQEAVVRINLLRNSVKLYDNLHSPSFVQEAFHHASIALQTELPSRSESYIISIMSDLCVKLPQDFVIAQEHFQKLMPLAQKFSGDHRAHIILSSVYRNNFAQTKDEKYIDMTYDSLDKAIELAIDKGQKSYNLSWAGRTAYNIFSLTSNYSHLEKAYNYHEKAGEIVTKSLFYSARCAHELYEKTNDETWKNKALTQYAQFLNSSGSDKMLLEDSKEHMNRLK